MPTETEQKELEQIIEAVNAGTITLSNAYKQIEDYTRKGLDTQKVYVELDTILRERLGFGGQ